LSFLEFWFIFFKTLGRVGGHACPFLCLQHPKSQWSLPDNLKPHTISETTVRHVKWGVLIFEMQKAMAAQQQRQTVTSSGIFNHEKHMAASTQSNITITSKGMCTKSSTISAASQVCSPLLVNYYLFGLWGYWHCGHSWPIVPASVDSEDDCGEGDGM
jgi:hypothetical protein